MKKSTKMAALAALLAFFAAFANAASISGNLIKAEAAQAPWLSKFENMTINEFLQLTPKKTEELTGQKLSIKQSIGLKFAQKKIKKQIKQGNMGGDSQLVALILVLFVGVIGVHRFYLGYIGIGIIQLLTLGMCGIWTLIDMILIITGDLQPKNGAYSETL